MNIVCVICSDLLVPSADVFHTPCGHVFHFVCLTQWLERSKTCPQCRERTTEYKIHRIYFNYSNNDSIVESTTTLQDKVDKMSFQLRLKDSDIKNLKDAKEKLEKQTAGLKQEVRSVEGDLSSKNSAIRALKDQINFYKQKSVDSEDNRKEIERLRKKVEDLRNLQVLIDASIDEVDEMISKTRDPATLVTYISVMKREMTVSFKKRRELRSKVKSLQQELSEVSIERNSLLDERSKRKQLEKQLITCESEKISLQSKLHNMETNIAALTQDTGENVCNKEKPVEKQNTPKACKENFKTEYNIAMGKTPNKLENTPKMKSDRCIIDLDSEEYTPQAIKSQGFFSTRDHGVKRTSSNSSLKVPLILAKKSKFNHLSQVTTNNGMTFDGFGGHAKHERFPNPIQNSHHKRIREETKTKKLGVSQFTDIMLHLNSPDSTSCNEI